MKKEVFIAYMKDEEYKFLGKPDTSNQASDDPNFNWEKHASQNQFQRSHSIISATDQEIENLMEVEFKDWFEEKSKFYHFYNDWKKKFKGSEFLIPVVEKEIIIRLRMLYGDFAAKLFGIKEGDYDIDKVIAQYQSKAEPEA